jgi:tetratricopeptide (TPR) repeat protein
MKPLRVAQPHDALFEYALSLREAGNLPSAISELESLAEDHSDDGALISMLAISYYEDGRYSEAVPLFRQRVLVKPTSMHLSVGLFFSLWNLAREAEALEELYRFQSVSDWPDYREILKDLATPET